ncbi:MAG TPA: 23S rRNA (pseudouridine(1915)-N(3))-methyltransferase RlmH [Alphaproteobacteria bacterium]
MRVVVAAIGRARAAPEQALFDDYARRLVRQGPAGLTLELREAEERRKLTVDARRAAEAELLSAQIPKGATVVALDGRGKPLSSEDFARRLQRWRDDGVGDLAFIIGGADGLDPGLVKRADLVLSLGALTWPHLLVRAMLAEQIYRAQSILLGHPYHRA